MEIFCHLSPFSLINNTGDAEVKLIVQPHKEESVWITVNVDLLVSRSPLANKKGRFVSEGPASAFFMNAKPYAREHN